LTLGFLFLDGWMRYAVIIGGAAIEFAEIAVWLKWRKVAPKHGMDTLVGMTGVALTDCKPDGQVKVKGQIWTAHCAAGVAEGEAVRVTAVDRIKLEVAAA
jgi:membrane protein implicated in regulation of membrane protease activity